MDWFVLGIEPTKDKKAITAAYRQKLRLTNPEDDPEGFKALRAAYEEALALAEQSEAQTVRDESPVGLWLEAVAAVYQDYPSRIDPCKWQALLRSDVCLALDTRALAEEGLLNFLMENFYLPKSVWTVLDEAFCFSQRREELYEAYPREFIDHAIINGIRLDPGLPYEMFIPGTNGADCDAYRRLYAQASQIVPAEVGPVLEQMDALSEKHPYGEALRFRCWLETGREQEGKEGFQKLAREYPENSQLVLAWAALCLEDGQVEEAEALAQKLLERDPESQSAQNMIAKCLAQKGLYHEAKEMVYELLHACGGDPIMVEQYAQQMRAWNEQLIAQREAKLAASPEDTENAMELAWCYAQNERLEDAMDLALRIDPAQADPFTYHNLLGKLSYQQEAFAQALEHLQTVEQILREMKPDGTKETEKRLRRLPEMLQIQGSCLMQLQQTEEARRKLEEALQLAPEDPEVLTVMGKILYVTGDYGYAVEILQRLIQVAPDAWHGELYLALSLYQLRRDREAFDAINRALAIQSADLSLYVLKMQVLLRNGVWEEVHGILDFLQQSGAPEDISVDYTKAQLLELERKDTKNAFAQYQKIARRVEGGEQLLWASELYYRMAVLMGEQMDVSLEDDRDILLAQIDKGLKHNPQDTDCLSYKAWVLKQGGQIEKAIEMYRDVEENHPHATAAKQGLAQLYYDNLELYAQEAMEYFQKLLEEQKTPELYFYAANCKRQMEDLEGARKCYLMELELDPEDIDGYQGLSLICDAQGKYEESLAYLEQAIAVMQAYEQVHMWLIEHKVQVLRRMGQYEKALACVDEAMVRYDYDGFQLKFDICCQFGLHDRAGQVLEDWKTARGKDPHQMAAAATLHMLTGKLFKAAWAMAPAKHKLPFDQIQSFRLQLSELENKMIRPIQIWTFRTQQRPKDDHGWMNLALAYHHAGMVEPAREAAQKALALLDDILKQHLTDETLFRSRRSIVLALLGREAEARAELEKTRSLPLCQYCAYGGCKDADIFEAYIEEIFGNKEKALALYQAGKINWPDELDFVSGETRLKGKGKKHADRN